MRPLAHFLLLGALLFAADRGLARRGAAAAPPASAAAAATAPSDEVLLAAAARRAGLDRLDAVVRARLVQNLRFLGHEGSDAALWRQARALGMDRSDVVVERRLAERMAARLRAEATLAVPDDATLGAWYERNGARWERDAAVAFHHVFVSREHHGEAAEARARALGAALRAEDVTPAAPVAAAARGTPDAIAAYGDRFPLGARVPLRREGELARQLGGRFARAVVALPPGRWSEPIESSYGFHLVRVDERRAGGPPPLAAVRAQVLDAWREEQGDAALRAGLVRLRGEWLRSP